MVSHEHMKIFPLKDIVSLLLGVNISPNGGDSLPSLVAHATGRQVADMMDTEGIRACRDAWRILANQFPHLAENWQERRDVLHWELLGAEMPDRPASTIIEEFLTKNYGNYPHEVSVIGK